MTQPSAGDDGCECEPTALSNVPAEEVTRSVLLLVDVQQMDENSSSMLHQLIVHGGARVVTTDGAEPVVTDGTTELIQTLDAEHFVPPLTLRELEVARLAIWGLTNRQIAEQLGTSGRTVGNQLQRVYDKLGIHDRRALRKHFDAPAPT